MQSYTARRNLFGDMSNKSDATTLTWADKQMNAHEKEILAMRPWIFLYRQKTISTTNGIQFYPIPGPIDKVESVYVTVSSIRYTPKLAASRIFWDELNMTSFASDLPTHWISFNGQVGLWPAPATSGNTITLNGRIVSKDLSIADYTTGTVSSVSNAGYRVVGSGTTWTAKMAGRWIQITDSDTAGTGDGQWYQIAEIPSQTFTVTIAAPGVFTTTNPHGLSVGQAIQFTTTGALPTGLSLLTDYFVINAGWTSTTFQVSATAGGTAVTTTGTQSGVHTIVPIVATALNLANAYNGPTVTAGVSYTIGQMSLLPEGFHKLPILDALRTYFTSVNPDPIKAGLYDGQYKELMKMLMDTESSPDIGMVLDYGSEGERIDNPNRFIRL